MLLHVAHICFVFLYSCTEVYYEQTAVHLVILLLTNTMLFPFGSYAEQCYSERPYRVPVADMQEYVLGVT